MRGFTRLSCSLASGERVIERLRAAGATAELVFKRGAGHGWETQALDMERFADWHGKRLTRIWR